MPTEYNFRFDELVIDQPLIKKLLGYQDTPLPAPFDSYLEDALHDAGGLADIRASFTIIDNPVYNANGLSFLAGGQEFNPGKIVTRELKGAKSLAFFVCTAGKTICETSADLLKGNNPVKGYLYNVLGSIIADAAGDKMQTILKDRVEKQGDKITNRYSPGYCNWSVADQPKLFSLFGGTACGVSLTDSFLMYPVKSISGVIGIGPKVKYREYQCVLCNSKNCAYRQLPE